MGQPKRLLDQVRDLMRVRRYALALLLAGLKSKTFNVQHPMFNSGLGAFFIQC